MTSYSFDINFTEMEMIALEHAVKFYIDECDRRIADGDSSAAYHKERLLDVLSKLHKPASDWVQYDKEGNLVG